MLRCGWCRKSSDSRCSWRSRWAWRTLNGPSFSSPLRSPHCSAEVFAPRRICASSALGGANPPPSPGGTWLSLPAFLCGARVGAARVTVRASLTSFLPDEIRPANVSGQRLRRRTPGASLTPPLHVLPGSLLPNLVVVEVTSFSRRLSVSRYRQLPAPLAGRKRAGSLFYDGSYVAVLHLR